MQIFSSKKPYSYTDSKLKKKKTFGLVRIFFTLFILYCFITNFFISPRYVGSNSMNPSVYTGDFIIVSPIVYGAVNPLSSGNLPGFMNPEHGDMVLLDPPYVKRPNFFIGALDSLVRFITFQRITFLGNDLASWEKGPSLKRIIGVPGDIIYMKDFNFYIKTSGSKHFLTEFEVSGLSYTINRGKSPEGWTKEMPFSGDTNEIVLKDGEYFVACDNRAMSTDSRIWGPIIREQIIGKAILTYWPFNRFGPL